MSEILNYLTTRMENKVDFGRGIQTMNYSGISSERIDCTDQVILI